MMALSKAFSKMFVREGRLLFIMSIEAMLNGNYKRHSLFIIVTFAILT